jgi:PilZ domain-containing protein
LLNPNIEVRAPRFPLHLAVRYRQVGAGDWCVGRTENISRSGVLVRTDEPVDVDVPIELRLEMPIIPAHQEPAEIWCRGRVVRTVAAVDRPSTAYAVAIEEYDFLPPSAEFLTH